MKICKFEMQFIHFPKSVPMNKKIKDLIECESKQLGISTAEFNQYVISGLRIILGIDHI